MKIIYSKPPKASLKISRHEFIELLTRIAILAKLNIKAGQKISVAFVTIFKIAEINKDFVGHTGVTDIISFDYQKADLVYEEDDVVAELIVSYEKAYMESQKRKGISFSEELTLYLVHGLLHVNGYDDLNTRDRVKMRRAEKRIMSTLKNEFNLNQIFQFKSKAK